MLSVSGTYARTRASTPSAGSTDIAATTAAAPAMSHFIVAIPAWVLIDRPPASKVTPLPTRANDGAPRRPGS